MVERETMTQPMLDFLRAAVACRLNVIVSGGTGAGKTTLLNVLSGFISNLERIVTIEDAAELMMRQRHVVRLETRPPNIEGKGAVRQRDLVVNALRMRPDRIIVGEVRSDEALDMLQAMNTGHDGSLTTIHANSPRDALYRLDTMVAMANLNLPERAVRQQIASAVHLVIQVTRLSDGTRKVTAITEVTGHGGRDDQHAGHLRLRPDGPAARRQGLRTFPGDRDPAALHRTPAVVRRAAAGGHVRARHAGGVTSGFRLRRRSAEAGYACWQWWQPSVCAWRSSSGRTGPLSSSPRTSRRGSCASGCRAEVVPEGPRAGDLTRRAAPLSALKGLDALLGRSGRLVEPLRRTVEQSGLSITIGLVVLASIFAASSAST